ncbi:MAG: 30S ribosomal protein S13 [Methanomassiliicoccales archaeon]|nr:MAG: 30S ribosomal protein S13 [Methanomassiliicoccales archaeon]
MADEKKENADVKDPAKQSEKEKDQKDDFKYIVRIANTDLDGDKVVVQALTAIKGIGDRVAKVVVNRTKIPKNEKIGNLSDEDIEKLENFVLELSDNTPGWLMNKQNDVWTGEDIHILGSEMEMRIQEDINILKKIRCYRGIRHEKGQKVRGQRTKAHGRTGLTVGVVKKAQKPGKT